MGALTETNYSFLDDARKRSIELAECVRSNVIQSLEKSKNFAFLDSENQNLSQKEGKKVNNSIFREQKKEITGRWLTFSEAKNYCKISTNTLKHWITSGYIYGKKVDGKWLVDRSSIDDFLESDKFHL